MPSGEARSSSCPSPSPPPPLVNWSVWFLQIFFFSIIHIFFLQCGDSIVGGDICVSASRAGPARVWHPTCFTCSCCQVRKINTYFWGKIPCQKYVYSEMIYHDTNRVKAHSEEVCFQFIHPSHCYHVENVDVSRKIFSVSREKYLYF